MDSTMLDEFCTLVQQRRLLNLLVCEMAHAALGADKDAEKATRQHLRCPIVLAVMAVVAAAVATALSIGDQREDGSVHVQAELRWS